ncbi:hypothetical protein [Streptomyces sp. TRM70350]|uniref:hypothetical protein n=1 Tax=Streptomyces sp. TRM70350 TaxID=2856165 RepID=UPI001C440673|nr:hypothetical protein [Streptomyces sp. TRM70350]MBV7699921.1 hypothetical protein [Streptomyces sp. TRM70350]
MTAVNLFRDTAAPLETWTQEADAVSLPRLDEVGGHTRPSGVGVTYAEQEYHTLADEQELIWPAEGERIARPFQERARGLDRLAAGAEFLLSAREDEVRQARADYQHAAWVLSPYMRREPGAKLRYWICWPVLWFGDTAGVWSAAVMNGDLPSIAFGQALASGLAAACAGLVGAELKYIRMAKDRQRNPETLTDDEQRYRRLFAGVDKGVGIVKLIGFFSLVVVALIAVGIFNLRAITEGSAAGLTFGLLAAATAIGSGLLGYSAADEVADLLAGMEKRTQKAERRYLKLARSSAFRNKARSEEAARSIHDEYQLRGQAAGKRVESLSWRVQRRNPQVLGHGYPVGEQGGVIGRRTRRGGAA